MLDDINIHRLIYTDEQQAIDAEETVREMVEDAQDLRIDEDRDGTPTWEVCFKTEQPLAGTALDYLLIATDPDSYALNAGF